MELSSPKSKKFQVGTFRTRKIRKHLLEKFLAQSLRNSISFFLKKISYISGGNLQGRKNKNLLCFGKNTGEVSTTARENPYEVNAASELSRKLRES